MTDPGPGGEAVAPEFPEFPPPPPGSGPPAATWRVFEAIPVFVIAIIATTAVGLAAVGLDSNWSLIVASAAFEISLAAGVLGWIRVLHRGAFAALGLPERPWREVGRGVVGGFLTRLVAAFGIGPLVVLLLEVLRDRAPTIPEQVPGDLSVLPQILLGVVVVVGAPIGEELFFRGFIFRSLRARHGFWLAGAVSSAAFGVVHIVEGNWFLVPIMFVVGLCFAYLYEREGRILTAISAHATFNLIGILFLTFGPA